VENITVSEVAVAAVTVPTAPLLNVTELCEAMGSKPNPLIVNVVVRLIAQLAVLLVAAGITVATCTAVPLLAPLVTITAVRLPAMVGLVENVTVSEVAVAAVTMPTAPLLKVIVLREATVLKPAPLMVIVAAFAARLAVLPVGTGFTVATWMAVPLLTPLVVTTAVKLPAIGLVEKVTVSEVAVAAVTVPTAPLLNVTVLLLAVVLKPKPLIVIVDALRTRLAVLLVTTGETVAICTAEPLESELVVTIAVKLPREVGAVENVTVSEVSVAAVTVPTAPLLSVTMLLLAVELKPKPRIVTVVALAPRMMVRLVTKGETVAT
jgi:hypothetical protein